MNENIIAVKANIVWTAWLAGCVCVVLSWFGAVSANVGWTGFWVATVISLISRLRIFGKDHTKGERTEDEIRREVDSLTTAIDRGERCRAEVLIQRGMCRQELAEWNESIADFSTAIELDSRYEAEARHWRGSVFYSLGQFEEAKDDLTCAIDRFRTDDAESENLVDALGTRAFTLLHLDEWDAAIDDINELVSDGSASALHLNARGQAWFHTRKFEDALADYQQALTLDLECAGAWHGISIVRACCPDHRLRDGTEAVRCSQRACQLSDWSDWSIISGLAAAYAEVGNFDKAVHYAGMALELASEAEKPERRERIEQFRQGQPYRYSGSSLIRPGQPEEH